jgi:SSS family transporter
MRRTIPLVGVALLLASAGAAAAGEASGPLRWQQLPSLPPAPGKTVQPGVAGAFVGVHRGVLLVAGGANFPDALPWDGGEKVWHGAGFVLDPSGADAVRWETGSEFALPQPAAYGASVTTGRGIVMIGGCDAEQCFRDVRLAQWDSSMGVVYSPLPSLPRPLAFMAAARIGDCLYVAGGQETMDDARATKTFLRLDLSKQDRSARKKGEAFTWEDLAPWPGPPRILPVLAAQSDGARDCLYLFSGRSVAPGRPTEILTDGYKYNPASGEWTRLGDVAPDGAPPRCVMGATTVASGANHILVFGGADGERFLKSEELDRAIAAADGTEAEALKETRRRLLKHHPGFSRDVLAYHTITDTWTRVGRLPGPCPVTTTTVRWRDGIVVPSGEVRPGVRTDAVWHAMPAPPPAFGTLNYTVLGAYLAVLVAMGIWFSRREQTTDDFFRAGGRVPWWAAGISIFGTQLSAITFMAIPAKTFATDWRYLWLNAGIVLIAPLIVYLILPFFRRLNVTTAYEYLERRFNLAARLIGSVMFMALHLGRIGIVLFLPSIALSVVTGIDVTTCILVMGLLSITYTVLGGIEAVIWTDVLQVAVLLGGALLSLGMIVFVLPAEPGELAAAAREAGKLTAFDFRFDLAAPTFWVILFGGLAATFISYGSDQTVIQRYLTTRDEASAARSIWTNAVLTIPATLIFFAMGTALFLFYRAKPDLLNPTLDSADAIFPWYIVTRLPDGVAGLLIAGVFAAAMSSLDSSMNSVATAVTTDWYGRFHPEATDRRRLGVARGVTVAVGLAGTALALVMAGWDIKSLWDQLYRFVGLFAGGLGGLFLLGIFSRRAHGTGAVIGLVASGIAQYAVSRYTSVHVLLYAGAGLVTCVVVGYAASLLLPARGKPLEGLTLYTLGRRSERTETEMP